MHKWFCCEVKISFVQAAIVFRKRFPTDEPDEEYIKKLAGDIMEYKVGYPEKILKDNISFYR